jgi:hypothetical protein
MSKSIAIFLLTNLVGSAALSAELSGRLLPDGGNRGERCLPVQIKSERRYPVSGATGGENRPVTHS